MATIQVSNLAFRYAGRRRPALDGVSFSVEAGETLLVKGASGAGKSTLALCLNGLIPHLVEGDMAGHVVVDGMSTRDVPVSRLAQHVGVVFQDPDSQLCTLTVEDEVAFGLENLRLPPAVIDERVSWALDQVGLAGLRRARLEHLSGGSKQRVSLAAALAMRPRVLVLDEPTAHLDPRGTREVFSSLAQLRARGSYTLVVIEHKVEALERALAVDRVIDLGAPADQGDDPEDDVVGLAQPWRGMGTGPLDPLAVDAEDLSFVYPTGLAALRGITLQVPSGDFVAVLGHNAAGKTTLARHLVGLLRPSSGRLRVLGWDASRLSPAALGRLVGFVFQNPEHGFVAEKVYDEVAYGLRVRGVPEPAVRARVASMLQAFHLESLELANPFTLSQGQKRRLSVAATLVVDPPILVLDEPTLGQDPVRTLRLMEMLKGLNRAGRTLVFITHDMRLVAEYARSAAVLANGRLIYHGPAGKLWEHPAVLERAGLEMPAVAGGNAAVATGEGASP